MKEFTEEPKSTEIHKGILRGYKLECQTAVEDGVWEARVVVKKWTGVSLEGHSRTTLGYIKRSGFETKEAAVDSFKEMKDSLKPLIDEFDGEDGSRDPLLDKLTEAEWVRFSQDRFRQ